MRLTEKSKNQSLYSKLFSLSSALKLKSSTYVMGKKMRIPRCRRKDPLEVEHPVNN